MKLAKDLRSGNIFKKGDVLLRVVKAELHKSTAGRRASTSEVKLKLEDLFNGNRSEITIDATDKFDEIILKKTPSQFLYKSENYIFMNQETFEQFELEEKNIEDSSKFLTDNIIVDVLFYGEMPIAIELPKFMKLKIEYTENAVKGDTTGKVTKSAKLESGLEIQVPLFCKIGDYIKVDTEKAKYIERA